MWTLYYAGISAMVMAIRISSLWNAKSKEWLQGRKNWRDSIQKIPLKRNRRIWFHVASLGEFEQAKPVIENLKKEKPETEIILSFFSPSGFNIKQHYHHATVVYLPPDLPGNADYYLDHIQPDAAVFVKYDLWPGYLKNLNKRKIPTFLISAYWDPNRTFSSWSNPFNKKLLKQINGVFLQRGDHVDYFKNKGFNNIHVSGDTRVDRSIELQNEVNSRLPDIFKEKNFDLVAGSTWEQDEKLLIEAIQSLQLSAIIAPHDVSPNNIKRLTQTLPFPFQLLSQVEQEPGADVIIIDSIGILSVLYSAGRIAYVGGGFGKGIHNILEPAAHHKPVIFGPRFKKFPEATEMIKMKGAFTINTKEDLISLLKELKAPGYAEEAGKKAYKFLIENSGSTGIVTKSILESIP